MPFNSCNGPRGRINAPGVQVTDLVRLDDQGHRLGEQA